MPKRNKFEHRPAPGPRRRERRRQAPGGTYWLYGTHAVAAALANPGRRIRRLVYAADAGPEVRRLAGEPGAPAAAAVERAAFASLLPTGAVHQGVAAEVEPLAPVDFGELCQGLRPQAPIVVLDQVTDPHNVGAILRSAAAFGAAAVVLTLRHAAPETGVLAKAASGALDHVPLVRVANLARALAELKRAGYWCVGLAAEASETLAQCDLSGSIAIVLGSEGEGLRRLTRETCDVLARLPTSGPIKELNVSNAAAVALYEIARSRGDARNGPRPT